MDKGLIVPKWVLIVQPKYPKCSRMCLPKPKSSGFQWKKASFGVRMRPMHAFIDQKASFLRDFFRSFFSILVDANPSLFDEHFFVVRLIHTLWTYMLLNLDINLRGSFFLLIYFWLMPVSLLHFLEIALFLANLHM